MELDVIMHYVYTIIGFFSLISLFVVLTPLLFKRLRKLFFLRILALISVLDVITAISLIMNISRSPRADNLSNDKLCMAQAVIYTFSSRASFSWVVGLSIQLYSMISYSKPYFSEISMHAIFWSIPIIVEIIPLFAGISYGMDDVHKYEAVEVCFNRIGQLSVGKSVVLIIGNQLYFYIGMIILILMYFWTNKAIQKKSTLANGTLSQLCEVAEVMRLYPAAAIVLYFPAFIYMLLVYIVGARAFNVIADSIFGVSVSLFGITNTLIYFSNSKQAHKLWQALIFGEQKKTIFEEEVFSLSKVIIDSTIHYEILDSDFIINDEEGSDDSQPIDDQVLERKSVVFLSNPLIDNSRL